MNLLLIWKPWEICKNWLRKLFVELWRLYPWNVHLSNFMISIVIWIALWSYLNGLYSVTAIVYWFGAGSALSAVVFRMLPQIHDRVTKAEDVCVTEDKKKPTPMS